MKHDKNILLVDLGNTSLKWMWAKQQKMTRIEHRNVDIFELLQSQWCDLPKPNAVWIASVASEQLNDRLREWITRYWKLVPNFMRTEEKCCGIRCAYSQPAHLGVDRWAAVIGAYQIAPQGACVVDCGTAVKLDVVTGNGEHLGGYILPGIEMMETALGDKTAIRHFSSSASEKIWGDSTATGIWLGVRKAIVALTEQSIERLQRRGICDPELILTGGAVDQLATLLEVPYQIRKQLVLEGLRMYAGEHKA